MASVKGRRIAVLATDGVEQVELVEPVRALREAGASVRVVSPKRARSRPSITISLGKCFR